MARIENHYNILALVLEGDESETAGGIVIGDLYDDFIKIMTEANSLLIPVVINQSTDVNDYISPSVLTAINSSADKLIFSAVEGDLTTLLKSSGGGVS